MTCNDEYSEFASQYDFTVGQFHCHIDAAVFGMMYSHVQPGEKVLDIGIGTGLSSERLSSYGMDVYGLDASRTMLHECERKGIAKELKWADATKGPLPYDAEFFDHVLTCGVLHFFERLDHVFQEAARVLIEGGTFTFTIMTDRDGGQEDGTVLRRTTKWERDVFHHGSGYIDELGQRNRLKRLSRLLVLGDIDPGDGSKNYYWIYVTRKE